MVLAQIFYVIASFFPQSWTGFSMLAFKTLRSFIKLSLASAIMLCRCYINQLGVATLGTNDHSSVRVSNELGAGRPKVAKHEISMPI
ncbi:hypothetical protein H5410_064711, partial [Solanum commersonii]